MTVKVKCIDNNYGCNLIVGKVYDAEVAIDFASGKVNGYTVDNQYYLPYRFVAVSDKGITIHVKCINARYSGGKDMLEHDRIYEVEHETDSRYQLVGITQCWRKNRFIVVDASAVKQTVAKQSQSNNIDAEEMRLRAALTSISDPFTCKKCGAPLATCERNSYH